MKQGYPDETGAPDEPGPCTRISEMLNRVGDKWTMLVIRALSQGPRRFNALRRDIGDISQKMLASTLRNLERDGFVSRTVLPTKPPQVEYALTPLGRDLQRPILALAQWTLENAQRIEAARAAYDGAAERQAAE
ncbi:winged helix-turn-helix transcriptional regulator [Frigidibacter sp. ROC022]|uniref:winged helix-turn-helix transcriptional regulator n=1 Tax=Frigidibacter sp. ROC022 TaxID=2971796 RepID=UPI00215AAFFC|nr:helix-turn-helix domain-containing protein [Frigidibacter sp. ROC022]MCR8725329.1 helix-turn-helix transcriptional regulator [Frigidibacter sp. ROC022]